MPSRVSPAAEKHMSEGRVEVALQEEKREEKREEKWADVVYQRTLRDNITHSTMLGLIMLSAQS